MSMILAGMESWLFIYKNICQRWTVIGVPFILLLVLFVYERQTLWSERQRIRAQQEGRRRPTFYLLLLNPAYFFGQFHFRAASKAMALKLIVSTYISYIQPTFVIIGYLFVMSSAAVTFIFIFIYFPLFYFIELWHILLFFFLSFIHVLVIA